MPRIEHAHPDLELGKERKGLSYALELPSAGLSPQTGVIFYIYGFASRYDDAYTKKLLRYFSDTYDCIALSVDYHGARSYLGAPEGAPAWPAEDFFVKLAEHHGISVTAPVGMHFLNIFKTVMNILADKGMERLHPECHFIKGIEGYVNFGLLPALDHLQVLHEVLQNHDIDRKRIYTIGTSYGGYVALLMAKFAPNTFRLVIDNSGFSDPDDTLPSVYGNSYYTEPVIIRTVCPFAFSPDPDSHFYFSASRRSVRNLGLAAHYARPSDTVFYSYHSITDGIAPTASKEAAVRQIGSLRNHDLRIIGEADLDGRTFKNLNHGMNASMRGLFELSYGRYLAAGQVPANHTDFDLATCNCLHCGDEDYVVTFGRDGVSMAITAQ